MARAMSFFHTQKQIADRSKWITRRKGWGNLKAGDEFWAIEKGKKGEKVKRLALLRCVSNRPEMLLEIDFPDVKAEGFPDMSPTQFVEMFCKHMGGDSMQTVNRIVFEYIDDCEGGTR